MNLVFYNMSQVKQGYHAETKEQSEATVGPITSWIAIPSLEKQAQNNSVLVVHVPRLPVPTKNCIYIQTSINSQAA